MMVHASNNLQINDRAFDTSHANQMPSKFQGAGPAPEKLRDRPKKGQFYFAKVIVFNGMNSTCDIQMFAERRFFGNSTSQKGGIKTLAVESAIAREIVS
jgi:hypothetical protein